MLDGLAKLVAPCLALALGPACASIPPVPAGYVSAAHSDPGSVNLGAHAGGITMVDSGEQGMASLQIDPYVTETLSIPVDGWGLRSLSDTGVTRAAGRVGVRQRDEGGNMAFGGGVGPNYVRYGSQGDDLDPPGDLQPGARGYGFGIDGEVAGEWRFSSIGLGIATRPGVSWNEIAHTTFWIPLDLHGAVFFTESLGLNLSLMGGWGLVFPDDRPDLSPDLDGLMGLTVMVGGAIGLVWITPALDAAD